MPLEYCIAFVAVFLVAYFIGRSDERRKREKIAVMLVSETQSGMRAIFGEEVREFNEELGKELKELLEGLEENTFVTEQLASFPVIDR
jgi:hypothetical protein